MYEVVMNSISYHFEELENAIGFIKREIDKNQYMTIKKIENITKKDYEVNITYEIEDEVTDIYYFNTLKEALKFANDYINIDDKEVAIIENIYEEDGKTLKETNIIFHKNRKL